MIAGIRGRLLRTPPGYRYSIGRVLAIYIGVMVTMMLAALDQTIVATALPHIVSDIGGLSNYSWVFSAYLLCQTISVPVFGKLGDIYGRRRMLLVAITVFLLGSALCGLARSMAELIAFRSLQGLGAGGLFALVFATVGEIVPPRDRGRYQGMIGAAFGSASILGPAVGGFIVDNATWRWIFYVNLPIGCAALVLVAVTMPKLTVKRAHQVDYIGAMLLAAGTAFLLLGLVWSSHRYTFASPHVLGAFAAAMALLGAFAFYERRVSEPILPFDVLKTPIVAAGGACMAMTAMCQFGSIVFVPLFVQKVIGTSATSSGVVITPLVLGAVTASAASGQWVSRTGRYRGNVLVGPVVLGVGMTLLWRMNLHTSVGEAARNAFVAGLGVGLMMQVFMVAAQSAVPLATIGVTTAFMQFCRSVGTTFGATIFGVIVNHGLPKTVQADAPDLVARSPAARQQLADAIHPAFLFAMLIAATVFVTAYVGVKGRPLRRTFDEAPPAEMVLQVHEL